MPDPDLKALRARAHPLVPALIVGEAGASDGLLDELDRMLAAQELVKVRFATKDRVQRKRELQELIDGTGSRVVLAIGKVATYWRAGAATRPNNITEGEATPEAAPTA